MRMLPKIAGWTLIVALTAGAALFALWIAAYQSLPVIGGYVHGDPLLVYDPELGFAPRPNSVSKVDGAAGLWNVYTDRRGARVSAPGAQTPDHADIVVVGCSFTWGLSLENEQTFVHKIGQALHVPVANLSMGGYSTVQALQLLRRNLDLAPKLVIYPFIYDHRRRNVLLCGPSAFPVCMDAPHVVLDANGNPSIVPPAADGIRRTELYAKNLTQGLDPLTWVAHGVDVVRGRVQQWRSDKAALNDNLQVRGLDRALEEMKRATDAAGAKLLVVLMYYKGSAIPPGLPDTIRRLNLDVLDLEPAYHRYESVPGRPPLHPATDAHPTAAGHQLIADELVAHIRNARVLAATSAPSSPTHP
jgi:hypothetical protein